VPTGFYKNLGWLTG